MVAGVIVRRGGRSHCRPAPLHQSADVPAERTWGAVRNVQDEPVSGLPALTPVSRRWLWFLLGGAAAIAGYYALLSLKPPSVVTDVADMVFPIAGVAGLAAGITWHQPVRPLAWYFLLAGESANLLGDMIGLIQRNVFHSDPYPSAADVGYLLAYPLVAAGLVQLVRR